MQVTIDIPDGLYGELASRAVAGRISLPELLLQGVMQVVHKHPNEPGQGHGIELPLIRGGEPGPLLRKDVNLNEVALMSDGEIDELLARR